MPTRGPAPTRGEAYDARFDRLRESGMDLHGEADLVSSLLDEHGLAPQRPPVVLDAGCGTGRVAVELARRGAEVTGVDVDPEMLAMAEGKSADVHWLLGDLARADLPRDHFDLALLAGNVMIFVEVGTEGTVLANVASAVRPGGLVVAGFQFVRAADGPGRRPLDPERYDRLCAACGLEQVDRWATWDRRPPADGDGYMVSVHRRRDGGPASTAAAYGAGPAGDGTTR